MKPFAILVFVVFFSLNGNSQCPNCIRQLDIAGSYGSISPDQVSQGSGPDNKTLTHISGAQFISVRYFLYAYLSLGFTGGFIEQRGEYADAYNKSVVKSTFTQRAVTIAPEVYYVYVYKKYFEAYTLLGLGVAHTTTTTITKVTAYTAESTTTNGSDGLKMQYTPIGIRVGGHLSGFVELGFGYKGVVNAGISFRFGQKSWWKQ